MGAAVLYNLDGGERVGRKCTLRVNAWLRGFQGENHNLLPANKRVRLWQPFL